jgi:hypothetical protein
MLTTARDPAGLVESSFAAKVVDRDDEVVEETSVLLTLGQREPAREFKGITPSSRVEPAPTN